MKQWREGKVGSYEVECSLNENHVCACDNILQKCPMQHPVNPHLPHTLTHINHPIGLQLRLREALQVTSLLF